MAATPAVAGASPLVVLLLESAGILLGTFACGVVPLYLSLSKTKLRVLEVLGAGLLVGASMTVVLPEGVDALYQSLPSDTHDGHHHHVHAREWAWSGMGRRTVTTLRQRPYDPVAALGIALLSGFLVMFLIDQIASPGAHVHTHSDGPDREVHHTHNHWHGPSHRLEAMRLTRASSLALGVGHQRKADASVEGSPEHLPADHDSVHHSQAPLLGHESSTRPRKPSDPAAYRDGGGDVSQSRGIRHAFSSIAGLIIHAAADGIAMGASAGSNDESLKLVVLLAIMIHKAPAAFGLCTLLMGQRLYKSDIRRAIALFSMSTPVGALATYFILSFVLTPDADGESAISPHHVGAALTFSAGTFLFVAMHAVQQLTSAAADLDLDDSHHHQQHHHHHHHHHHRLSDDDGRPGGAAHERVDNGSATSPSPAHSTAVSTTQPPRQILGRTGRVAVFLLGTILPKVLQSIVGHHH